MGDIFHFKQFTIRQDRCAFKVGTDGVILGAYANVAGAENILDIGSGTGLIAIMCAQRCDAVITALEPDGESFLQLRENIEACSWSNRIKPVNARLQDYEPGFVFDLIISNPPYFINSIRNPDSRKSAARHNDDLSHAELIYGVLKMLRPGGQLQVIMPLAEGSIFIAEAEKKGLYCNEILNIRPLPNTVTRRVVLTLSRHKEKISEKFITISSGARYEFTEEYILLTREFYLKF